MNEIHEQPLVVVSEQPAEQAGQPVSQLTQSPAEKTGLGIKSTQQPPESMQSRNDLAKSMKDDPRAIEIRKRLVEDWRKRKGDYWYHDPDGGLNLRSDFQDFMYGSPTLSPNSNGPQTLDGLVEEEFRKRFPEVAKQYDQMEEKKIYGNPNADPAIIKLNQRITTQTNTDPNVTKALSMGGGSSGESFARVWERANTRATLTAYRDFVHRYPAKAEAYASRIPIIARILRGTQANGAKEARAVYSSETISQGVDPRDYFRSTVFQKEAEQIDPDKSHPWEKTIGDGFLISDEFGQVALAETLDLEETIEDKKGGLLLAETAQDGQASSIYIRNELSPRTRRQLAGLISEISPRLSGEMRHTFVRNIIKLIPSLKDQPADTVEEVITTLVLKLLPDHSQGVELKEIPKIDGANARQQEQLSRLIKLASQKIPLNLFFEKLGQFTDGLRWTDDPFGRNYTSTLADIRSLVLNSREDTTRNYNALRRKEPADYPIKDRITRDVSSEEELKIILLGLPVKPMPDVRFAPRSTEQAELVSLDRVLGATNISDWTISTSEGRGVKNIFKILQALKDGSMSVVGNNKPIKAIEVNGEIFIESDGRHRVAALKALGVDKVPMLVSHIKNTKNRFSSPDYAPV